MMYMDFRAIAKENEGFHTVETFSRALGIGKGTAINYLYAMRKKGFVKTQRGRKGKRIYNISPLKLKEIGYPGLIETLNRYSSIKLTASIEERADHELSPEEAVVRSLLTKDFRIIMASLELFKITEDWWSLYRFAREHRVERPTGALYSLSRKLFRVRSMDKRVLRLFKKSKTKERYIIPKMKSSDFKNIEKEWGIFIPFNKSDLERLRR